MSLETLKELEKAISSIAGTARKDGVVRIISSYDIDAVVAAGIVIRYLMQNGIRFEYLALPSGLPYRVLDEVPSVIVDVEIETPSGRVGVSRSTTSLSRVGSFISISSQYYSQTVMRALENLMVVTNDIRFYTLAATLSKSIPRVRVKQLDSSVRNFINEMTDRNLVKVIRGIRVFNYLAMSIDAALSSSLDVFIPGYSGIEVPKDVRVLTEEELVKDLLTKLESVAQSKFSPSDLYGDVYLVTQDWLFKDVYELLYALLTLLDLYGAEYVVLAVMDSSYASFLKQVYKRAFKGIVSSIYYILKSKDIHRVKQSLYRVKLDGLTSLTPVSKVMKSYLLPVNALVIYEIGGSYYVPASDIVDIKALIKGSYEMVGGLVKFKEFKIT